MNHRAHHVALAALALTAAVGRPTVALAQDGVAFGAHHWTYGTGRLSEHHFRYATGPGGEYWLTYGVEPGSFHHLMNGTDVLSAHWWLNSTRPGSAHYWKNGTGVGSDHHWRNGTGCLSEHGWRVGATCDELAARFVVTLCVVRAIRIEPCAMVEAALTAWLPGQDEWYSSGDGATRRVEDMRAAMGG